MPLGTHANKLGRIVGENLSGGALAFGGVLGTAIPASPAETKPLRFPRPASGRAQPGRPVSRPSPSSPRERRPAVTCPKPTRSPRRSLADAAHPERSLVCRSLAVPGPRQADRHRSGCAVGAASSVDDLAWMDLALCTTVRHGVGRVVPSPLRRVAEVLLTTRRCPRHLCGPLPGDIAWCVEG